MINNNYIMGGVGESIPYPEKILFITNLSLEKVTANIKSFFDDYKKQHTVQADFSRNGRDFEGGNFVYYTAIGKNIDHIYNVYVRSEEKKSFFDTIFSTNKKYSQTTIQISFDYIPPEDEQKYQKMNYDLIFATFIKDFEEYVMKKMYNLKSKDRT